MKLNTLTKADRIYENLMLFPLPQPAGVRNMKLSFFSLSFKLNSLCFGFYHVQMVYSGDLADCVPTAGLKTSPLLFEADFPFICEAVVLTLQLLFGQHL